MKKLFFFLAVLFVSAGMYATITSLYTLVGETVESEGGEETASADFTSLMAEDCLPLQFINDEVYPWNIVDGEATSGNRGQSYTSSSLKFAYSSDCQLN